MDFSTFLVLILISLCIPLSRCCSPSPQYSTLTCVVRRLSNNDDYLMFGSLIRENVVITTPHYLVGAHVENVSVEANCERITNKLSLSNSCIRRSVSKIIFEDNDNTTRDLMDSIAIIILKTPFSIKNNNVQLIPFADDIESVDTLNCVHVKWEVSRDIDKVVFYYGSFHKEAFDYQAKVGKTTLISKSAFEFPVFPKLKNKTSLYNFISEQDHNIEIIHDMDEKFLGTPIFCPHVMSQTSYFLIGIANYFFLVNSKIESYKSKKILYYIDVIHKHPKIWKKTVEALRQPLYQHLGKLLQPQGAHLIEKSFFHEASAIRSLFENIEFT